jgi:hypothetical protein
MVHLNDMHKTKLRGFLVWVSRNSKPIYYEQGHIRSRQPPLLVETLCTTSRLLASNDLDHIYGILGLTNTPSRAIPLHDWHKADRSFVPIDYSATLPNILVATTMYLLRSHMSIKFLANFWKEPPGGEFRTKAADVPSWVFDWRALPEGAGKLLSNPLMRGFNVFRKDNETTKHPNQLVLRGRVLKNFSITSEGVWNTARKGNGSVDSKFRFLGALETDILVRFSASEQPDLWILRPRGVCEYEIMGCQLSPNLPSVYENEDLWEPEGDIPPSNTVRVWHDWAYGRKFVLV